MIHRRHLLYIGGAALIGILFFAAIYSPVPNTDSGVFLYIARQMLSGKVPYRDIWDHKPPIIFFIDAIGLLIGQGQVWGVWIIEFLSLFTALTISVVLLRQVFGSVISIIVSIIWVSSLLLVLEGGNLTEEYGLVFQFAALYLFWRLATQTTNRQTFWLGLGLGVSAAILFWLRQNLIGVPLSAVICLCAIQYRRPRHLLMLLIAVAAGIAIVSSLIGVYIVMNGVARQFFDAAFRYNFAYSTTSIRHRLQAIQQSLWSLAPSGITFLAIAGWLAGILSLRSLSRLKSAPLLRLALLNFVVELLLVSLSGRTYLHYAIVLLPTFAILTAFLLESVFGWASGPTETITSMAPLTVIRTALNRRSVQIALAVVVCILPVRFVIQNFVEPPSWIQQGLAATNYLKSNTTENQYVLMWGAETTVNTLANRPSPARFVYQTPLFTPHYASDALFTEFLADLKAKPPTLIIDASSGTEGSMPALNNLPENASPALRSLFEYVEANYQQDSVIPDSSWTVWKVKAAG